MTGMAATGLVLVGVAGHGDRVGTRRHRGVVLVPAVRGGDDIGSGRGHRDGTGGRPAVHGRGRGGTRGGTRRPAHRPGDVARRRSGPRGAGQRGGEGHRLTRRRRARATGVSDHIGRRDRNRRGVRQREVARGDARRQHALEFALGHPTLGVEAESLVLHAVTEGVFDEGDGVVLRGPRREPTGRPS